MARRVNSRFLIILGVFVLGGVASAFVLKGPIMNMVKGDRSKQQIAAADALVKEADGAEVSTVKREKLQEAVRSYQMAVASDARNPEVFVKLGDALSKMAQFDVFVYLPASRQSWEKALEVQPEHVPALRRLMDSFYKEAQVNPQAGLFTKLRERAEALHKLDPKDLRAHAVMYIAPLNRWLANIETSASEVEPAIAELSTLIEENPTAPEIPDMVYFVAGAKAKKAIDAKRGGQDKQGNVLLEESRRTFTDAIKGQGADTNAYLHYRFFELLNYIRQKDDPERDRSQHYSEQLKSELEIAQRLTNPEDENYVKIKIAAHQLAMQLRQPKVAEKILLDLHNQFPSDQKVRLALARFWHFDKDKQAEAIALMEQPIVDTGWNGVEAMQKLDLEVKSLMELANLYIDRFFTLSEAERPEALKQVEATYDKVYDKAHERSEVLKIRGKIERLKGGQDASIKAIQTFEKAQRQFRTENVENREDTELMYLLAQAYMASRQTGEAKTQLLKLNDRSPDNYTVKLMLAQVLIAEGDIKGARSHVDYLQNQAPEEPEVLRLVLATRDPVKDVMEVKKTYEKLPEGTGLDAQGKEKAPAVVRAERMMKAMVATLSPVSNPDDALRLYNAVLSANPADFDALQGAQQILVARGKKDQALALLKAGLAAKPGDAKIALVIQQLEGASAEVLKLASEELIRKQYEKDPFTLELKLYQFHMTGGDRAEAFKHLEAAEKVKPDDGTVLDLLFQSYLADKNWDKAASYVDRLAAKSWDQANGLIYRYRLAMTRGDVPGALEYARQLTGKLEQFARSWVFLGQAQQASGLYADAISSYGVALDKQSENPEAIAGIITCYMQLDRKVEALRYIERGRAAFPTNAYFREQWKAYMLQFGNPAEVIQPALAERDANPEDPSRWLTLGRAQYAAARKKDDVKSAQYAADAKATFTQAIKKWPAEKVLWAYLSELMDFTKDTAGGEALLKDMIAREQFKDTPEPTMMLADHYLRQNKPQDAEAVMKKALVTFPANGDVKRRMASYYTQKGEFDKALALLDPASPDKMVRQQIVEIYLLTRRYVEAEKMLRGLIASNDRDGQLYALLGVVQLNEAREEQGMESFTTALTLDPKNQTALYSRGQLRLKGRPPQLDGAVKDLVALRDANPKHLDGRVLLAEAFRQQLRFEEAAHELSEVLAMVPNRNEVRMSLVAVYAAMKPPMWSEAERVVAEAERNDPKELMWKRMQSKMYSARGLHEKAALKIREALVADSRNGELLKDYLDILEAGRMWPQLLAETERVFASDREVVAKGWWAYVKRAVALSNLDRKQEGMADFVKALEIVQGNPQLSQTQDISISIIDKIRTTLDNDRAIGRVAAVLAKASGPEASRWRVVLAYLYLQTGDLDRASTLVREALDASNMDEANTLTALHVAGNVYMAAGKYEPARAVYEQVLTKASDDLGALNNLACIMAEHTDVPNLPKALEYSQRAVAAMTKANRQDPSVLDTVGWMNVLAGGAKLDEGIDYLVSSIKAGEIAEAQYHLGEAYLKKQLPANAKTNLLRAREMLSEKKQAPDEILKKRIEDALARVEKALLEVRASNP